MLVKNCNLNETPNPKNYEMCIKCRTKKYEHSKNKACLEGGKPINNKATWCKHHSQIQRRATRISICKICNKSFVFKKDRSAKYCSIECRQKDTSRPNRRKNTETITPKGYVNDWNDYRNERTFI